MTEKICPSCGRKFLAKFNIQKYCSLDCAVNHPTSKTVLPVEPIKISVPPIDDKNKTIPPVTTVCEKTCLVCGKKFFTERQHAKRKYCSDKCREKHDNDVRRTRRQAKSRAEKTCIICGEKFFTERQHAKRKYCSDECRNKRNIDVQRVQRQAEKKSRAEKTCPTCGKKFFTERQHAKRKYCSDECREKHDNDVRRTRRQAKSRAEKTCIICGKKFRPKDLRQKYCSDECRVAVYKASRRPHDKKICPTCGKEFVQKLPRQRFCSQKCRYQAQLNPPAEKTCILCGKVFQPRNKRQKICSECQISRKTPKRHSHSEEIICLNCGEHFFDSPSKDRKFCSEDCYREYYRKLSEKKNRSACEVHTATCEICGKEFPKHYGSKYCSDECRKIASKQSNHGSYRRKVTPRDPNKKTIEQWAHEALQCGMSYGKYRAAIASGKTFDELKLPEREPSEEKILYECKI